ncbi:MAG: GxxExxY protein [Candidatus Cloacimonetes bacterium]|nr:GxxExxY protein [Candidatus Cloacimonadota bacterium]
MSQWGFRVDNQVPIDICYKGCSIGTGYRLDLLVEGIVIVELKSVEKLCDVHHEQLLSYLRLLNIKLGYLINFNPTGIDKNIVRYANKL